MLLDNMFFFFWVGILILLKGGSVMCIFISLVFLENRLVKLFLVMLFLKLMIVFIRGSILLEKLLKIL